MNKGYIYVLTNKFMPELIKIGKTSRDPKDRAIELGRATGVPGEFQIYYSIFVPDMDMYECLIHSNLKDYRVEGSEFFRYREMVDSYFKSCNYDLNNEQLKEQLVEIIQTPLFEEADIFLDEYKDFLLLQSQIILSEENDENLDAHNKLIYVGDIESFLPGLLINYTWLTSDKIQAYAKEFDELIDKIVSDNNRIISEKGEKHGKV